MISDNYVTGDNIYLRELQNFFFEVLGMMSITHYGAIGDGRRDNYGPLQVAIDDAIRRGLSFLYVPYGKFIYTGEFTNLIDPDTGKQRIIFMGNPHAHIVNIRTGEEIEIHQFGWYTGGGYYTKEEADGRFVNISGDTMTGSLAIGSNSTASGDLSFAQGWNNTASGLYSHAQGWSNTASGKYSFAGGTLATASGFDSIAFGNYIVEPNEYIGDTRGNQATGNTSIALGTNTIASGGGAISTGYQTTASGECSFTQGGKTTASGNHSHAEGYQTTASNLTAHAEGYQTTASGNTSHAEGDGCVASGVTSHAECSHTTASGHRSHAEGWKSIASNNDAHAEGYWTIAQGKSQHTEGELNIVDTGTTEGSETRGTYIHIAGNGTFVNEETQNRSNAYTLDWNGNGWFAGDVYVGSTSGTNKDEGSKKLATEEYVDTHSGGGSKSIITGTLDDSFEATSDTNYPIPLTLSESSGTGISIVNNGITIGSGVSKVKVTGIASVYADTAGATKLALYNDSTKVFEITKTLQASSKETLVIPNYVLPVSSGDVLYLQLSMASGDIVYANSTWLTVEEV